MPPRVRALWAPMSPSPRESLKTVAPWWPATAWPSTLRSHRHGVFDLILQLVDLFRCQTNRAIQTNHFAVEQIIFKDVQGQLGVVLRCAQA